MKIIYKTTKTTVSLLNYHFVFCPRYRRKIFLIPNLEERFKEVILTICEESLIDLIAIECDEDHVHLFVSCLPTLSPSSVMQKIKELYKMPNLWTRSYFVSTAGSVSNETIKNYVQDQKKRYL